MSEPMNAPERMLPERIEFGNGWYGRLGAYYDKDYYVIFGPAPYVESNNIPRMFLEKCRAPGFVDFVAALSSREEPASSDAVEVAEKVRSQNWKNGGVLALDSDEAAALIQAYGDTRVAAKDAEIARLKDLLGQARGAIQTHHNSINYTHDEACKVSLNVWRTIDAALADPAQTVEEV